MALLDMARKKNVYLEVGHVNYHHRDSADRDEKIARKYCREHGIKFHKKDFVDESLTGNFQHKAREFRYRYFNDLCKKNNLDEVLIAHNMDDFIETYYMQKDKGLGVSYYGIKERNNLYGANVYRPLLDSEKKELKEYCDRHNIVYGIDESNLKDEYTRNRIRHSKVEKMSSADKKKLYEKIIKENTARENRIIEVRDYLLNNSLDPKEFRKIKNLKDFMHDNYPGKSDKTIDEYIRQLCDCDTVIKGNTYTLSRDYGHINTYSNFEEYSYTFKDYESLFDGKYEYFKIRKKGTSFEGVTVDKKDFPLTIRNNKPGDKIAMNYGCKKINRFFIDKKIPYCEREKWPVVVNRNGEIILVPGIGCDKYHYSNKHNLFVIKL